MVETAVNSNKIVLFGSFPDKGPIENWEDYYPVGLPGVLMIDSSSVWGEQSKEKMYAEPDLLLPGEDLMLVMDDKVSGSSFATALNLIFFFEELKDEDEYERRG
ncbi:hypothetical protein DM02DRAFT_675606 [Periconia macrospinosa]|uniref:Uncharacterized protein n=1 Tax=Periconia macrospinosa TaxID=97972 RepID=A0A2V1DCK2_9PLEO|nr:hypothetical protein DM02DRAFT_675606 [Periconia macrospinosa]